MPDLTTDLCVINYFSRDWRHVSNACGTLSPTHDEVWPLLAGVTPKWQGIGVGNKKPTKELKLRWSDIVSSNSQDTQDKNSPQIVGLRPPMCSQILRRQTLMRINWIFWCSCNYNDSTTPINSKCCSIIFRGVLRSSILGVRGVFAGWRSWQ